MTTFRENPFRRGKTMGWYASGAGIARSGPYVSRYEAELAFALTPDAREKQRLEKGTECPYPYDLLVWRGPWRVAR